MPSQKQIDKALNNATISLSKHAEIFGRAIELISEISIKRYTQKEYQALVLEIGHEIHALIDLEMMSIIALRKGGRKMTNQTEQWSLIVYVIWPIGFYLMLAMLNFIDNRRGIK